MARNIIYDAKQLRVHYDIYYNIELFYSISSLWLKDVHSKGLVWIRFYQRIL